MRKNIYILACALIFSIRLQAFPMMEEHPSSGKGRSTKEVEVEAQRVAHEREREAIDLGIDEAAELTVEQSDQQNGNDAKETEKAEESRVAEFSLADFRKALAENPTAVRFIITRDEFGNASLEALEEEATRGKSKSENMVTIAALRAALAVEQPNINIEDLLPVSPVTSSNNYPSLSAERLQAVFKRINKENLQKKLKDIERKIAAAKAAAQEAKTRGDQKAAELHGEIAKAWGNNAVENPGAQLYYWWAFEAHNEGRT